MQKAVGGARAKLTQDDNGLLGGILLELRVGMAVIVDHVASVSNKTQNGEVCEAPCPAEGSAKLARLGLGSFVRVGSSEGDTAGCCEAHNG